MTRAFELPNEQRAKVDCDIEPCASQMSMAPPAKLGDLYSPSRNQDLTMRSTRPVSAGEMFTDRESNVPEGHVDGRRQRQVKVQLSVVCAPNLNCSPSTETRTIPVFSIDTARSVTPTDFPVEIEVAVRLKSHARDFSRGQAAAISRVNDLMLGSLLSSIPGYYEKELPVFDTRNIPVIVDSPLTPGRNTVPDSLSELGFYPEKDVSPRYSSTFHMADHRQGENELVPSKTFRQNTPLSLTSTPRNLNINHGHGSPSEDNNAFFDIEIDSERAISRSGRPRDSQTVVPVPRLDLSFCMDVADLNPRSNQKRKTYRRPAEKTANVTPPGNSRESTPDFAPPGRSDVVSTYSPITNVFRLTDYGRLLADETPRHKERMAARALNDCSRVLAYYVVSIAMEELEAEAAVIFKACSYEYAGGAKDFPSELPPSLPSTPGNRNIKQRHESPSGDTPTTPEAPAQSWYDIEIDSDRVIRQNDRLKDSQTESPVPPLNLCVCTDTDDLNVQKNKRRESTEEENTKLISPHRNTSDLPDSPNTPPEEAEQRWSEIISSFDPLTSVFWLTDYGSFLVDETSGNAESMAARTLLNDCSWVLADYIVKTAEREMEMEANDIHHKPYDFFKASSYASALADETEEYPFGFRGCKYLQHSPRLKRNRYQIFNVPVSRAPELSPVSEEKSRCVSQISRRGDSCEVIKMQIPEILRVADVMKCGTKIHKPVARLVGSTTRDGKRFIRSNSNGSSTLIQNPEYDRNRHLSDDVRNMEPLTRSAIARMNKKKFMFRYQSHFRAGFGFVPPKIPDLPLETPDNDADSRKSAENRKCAVDRKRAGSNCRKSAEDRKSAVANDMKSAGANDKKSAGDMKSADDRKRADGRKRAHADDRKRAVANDRKRAVANDKKSTVKRDKVKSRVVLKPIELEQHLFKSNNKKFAHIKSKTNSGLNDETTSRPQTMETTSRSQTAVTRQQQPKLPDINVDHAGNGLGRNVFNKLNPLPAIKGASHDVRDASSPSSVPCKEVKQFRPRPPAGPPRTRRPVVKTTAWR